MLNLTINGRAIKADEGEMLLTVLRREKIDVPSLCHHQAVEPSGACRLCVVEITRDSWDGWCKYVTSCLYPVEEGLIVNTHADKVNRLRKSIVDLYLARCPNSEAIQKLAAEYGITTTSYETVVDGDDCILCGLCTRICDHMGFHAISTAGRGHGKLIAPPLDQPPPDCTGCLSCALVCPTDFIKYSDENGSRTIWGKQFEMIACFRCGKETITKEFADYLSKQRDIPDTYFEICDDCHRRDLAGSMGKITSWQREEAS